MTTLMHLIVAYDPPARIGREVLFVPFSVQNVADGPFGEVGGYRHGGDLARRVVP
jgi:hypothetical protein